MHRYIEICSFVYKDFPVKNNIDDKTTEICSNYENDSNIWFIRTKNVRLAHNRISGHDMYLTLIISNRGIGNWF